MVIAVAVVMVLVMVMVMRVALVTDGSDKVEASVVVTTKIVLVPTMLWQVVLA